MRRFTIPAIILLALTGVQNSLFEYIKIFGVKPDIVLTFIICLCLIRGNPEGTIIGIIGGMLEDIFFGYAFGINSIACMVTALLIGIVEGSIYKDNIVLPAVFTFLGTVIKESIVFLFLYLTKINPDIMFAVTNIIIPEAIYNTILAAIFYRYIFRMCSRLLPETNSRF